MTADSPIIIAHKKSIFHKSEILESDVCGCFCCFAIFHPSKIERWTDKDLAEKEETTLCPECGIDSVIGCASGFPITKNFYKQCTAIGFSKCLRRISFITQSKTL